MDKTNGKTKNGNAGPARQHGVALILSLLLLFVLVILGVAGFNNAQMQERAAGNGRLQAVAFQAASAGATNAINFFDAHRDLGPDQLCGSPGHTGWDEPTEWVDQGSLGEATLKQRMYCLADAYPCTEDDVDCDIRPPRSQLFVLSRGEVTSGGRVVAQRDVEIRINVAAVDMTGDGCGAICFPGCQTGTMTFPNSNAFQVDGSGGPAISAGCPTAAQTIRNAIRNNRIGNYIGGVVATVPGPPWDSPTSLETFRTKVQELAIAAQAAGTCQTTCYSPTPLTNMGNAPYGSVADPQITYIHGSASFGGNISGAGILMVNGNLSWNGTPNYKGLIVVLGGNFSISGGGHGGNQAGSVVIVNAHAASATGFGPAGFQNIGGGTANYTYSCASLWAAHDLLDIPGQGMWSPECESAPPNPHEANLDDLVVASWRENIGWREEFFGSD